MRLLMYQEHDVPDSQQPSRARPGTSGPPRARAGPSELYFAMQSYRPLGCVVKASVPWKRLPHWTLRRGLLPGRSLSANTEAARTAPFSGGCAARDAPEKRGFSCHRLAAARGRRRPLHRKTTMHVRLAGLSVLALMSSCASVRPAPPAPRAATLRTKGGAEIAYDVRGGGDVTLLFVHGWCCDRGHWREQLDAFADTYRVVSVDLAGHGDSRAAGAECTVSSLAHDVAAVAQALELDRLILIGHSMGGPVSLAAAALLPGRARAVVAVDSLHNAEFVFPEEAFRAFQQRFDQDFAATMEESVRAMVPAERGPELPRWIVERALRTDRAVALSLFQAFPALEVGQLLRDARVPVRCINSSSAPVPTAADVNGRYADYAAVLMDGVGHYPMLERPGEFNERLRQALGELEE